MDLKDVQPQPLDPHQATLGEGFPERFTSFEDAYGTLQLELALVDDSRPPSLLGKESEQYLTPTHPPAEYLLGARIHAFKPIDPKTGKRPQDYPKGATTSLLLAQEKEVLETTIVRVAGKYHDMQVSTERLASLLHLDETQPDTSVAIKNRAEVFGVLALSQKGPVAEAYKRLRRFCTRADLKSEDSQRILDLMDDAFQTNNTDRLNRIAKLTLAHEVKRADWFRRIQISYANYRLERMPIWHRIDWKFLGWDEMPSLPMLVRDETVAGRLGQVRRTPASKQLLAMSDEDRKSVV